MWNGKIVWQFLIKLIYLTIWPSNPTLRGYTQVSIFRQTIYMTVYRGFTGNSSELEIIQHPLTGEWIDKLWYSHMKEHCSALLEWTTDTCNSMYEFQMHYFKGKKPNSKYCILYNSNFIYMTFWERQNYRDREQICDWQALGREGLTINGHERIFQDNGHFVSWVWL